MTERLHFHFSLLCIGEGNGNPLQCSSLENPRDGGAWWAAVYGVTQSRTRLKRLSSCSSKINVGWGSERDIEGDTDGGKDRDTFKERMTEAHTNKGKKSGEREKTWPLTFHLVEL